MKLICLGVGDAFSALSYGSSLIVEADGYRLLIDCPHPIRKILREAGLSSGRELDIKHVDAVVLTHLHADHASGLEGYAFYNRIVLGRTTRLAAHGEVIADLWDRHLAITLGVAPDPAQRPPKPTDFFEFVPLDTGRPIELGAFLVECRRTIHPIPTFALRLRAGSSCLGLSADTSFDPGLIEWLAEADLIVHETNYGIHTPYEKLAALPAPLRARMRLIHYPDDFDLQASCITPLRPGEVIEIIPRPTEL